MTARFTRKNFSSGHAYYLDGKKLPGVTSIIGVLDKPALVNWAATITAGYAIDNWDRLAGVPIAARLKELEGARWQTNKRAAVRGTRIHALAERLARGEEITTDDRDLEAAARAYAGLLDAWELEPIGLELSCLNTSYEYAGTVDGIFHSPRLGTVIADVKTGKRAYSEVALQLAAYRYCDIYLEEVEQFGPRGGKLKSTWTEEPMPDVDGAVVIHIEQETDESPAAARLMPVKAGPAEWDVFLFLREIHEAWIERTGYAFRDKPSYSPPIGAELYPEMSDSEIREALAS